MKTNDNKKLPQSFARRFAFLRAALVPALALVLALSGAAANADKPRAAASIAPLHSLLAGVIGDAAAAPVLLIEPGQSPHHVQLVPSKVRALHEADVFFYIGEGGESFSRRLLHSVKGKKIAFAKTISTLPYRRPNFLRRGKADDDKHDDHHGHDEHAEHDDDHHEHDDHDDRDEHDEHDDDHRGHKKHDKHKKHKDRRHGHNHGGRDVHIWLDIDRARQIVKQMADALGETDPARRETYLQNAAQTDAKLAALDGEIAAMLAGAQGKPFAVAHDAYHYFERKYGLAQPVALRGGDTGGLSARRLRAARQALRARGIRCVFREPQLPARHLIALVEDSDAVIGVADPLGANIPAGAEQYFTLMRRLAKSFADCLNR